jgi:ribosome-associated translation inhibitor RaiA
MKIQVNTDNNILGDESLTAQVEEAVTRALRHVGSQVTRVEVHIGDQNSGKGGETDKRCMMEARLEGLQPVAVSHDGPTVAAAMGGAADKLTAAITRVVGKLDASRRSRPEDVPPTTQDD